VSRELAADARSWLFVPASRPDRFAKAAASGADMVILDLEDAVPAEQKVSARADAVAWLSGDEVALVPQVETAAGLTRASELGSVPGVTRLAFGHLDFAVDVDASPTGETMTWARSRARSNR
jgi:citrate lyase subunit beta / citryl-CoA lyase